MLYSINLKNIKRSAFALADYLKEKGFNLPRHISLEAVARVLLFKNYNTLEALANRPRVLDYYQPEKKYLFEITIDCEKNELLKMLKDSFQKANAILNIQNFLQDKKDFYFELDLTKTDSNILAAIMELTQTLKNSSYKITRFEYCRVTCEKSSLMSAIHTPATPKIYPYPFDLSQSVSMAVDSTILTFNGGEAASPEKEQAIFNNEEQKIRDIMDSSYQTVKALGLDMEDMLNEHVKHVASLTENNNNGSELNREVRAEVKEGRAMKKSFIVDSSDPPLAITEEYIMKAFGAEKVGPVGMASFLKMRQEGVSRRQSIEKRIEQDLEDMDKLFAKSNFKENEFTGEDKDLLDKLAADPFLLSRFGTGIPTPKQKRSFKEGIQKAMRTKPERILHNGKVVTLDKEGNPAISDINTIAGSTGKK